MNKTKFEGTYKAGVIVSIVGASISLAWVALFGLIAAIGMGVFKNIGSGFGLATLIICIIGIIPSILILIFGAKSLKDKSADKRIAIGIMSIIFGVLLIIFVFGIILLVGGIMMLSASKEITYNDNPQNMTE
ncbi:hypothetical protein ELUMI_v1c02200 [Williamsoniiplasma luminosum]|uniref:Uncharacterized protein n=1 Tax=Williamsoniiplasma luminosum TaxID=214888 RepID=A0A2K8NSW7_9MOLU|nr:hypothetical protein [Williamsoniiplasma luminosum]ATZ16945.1 hypothetical protein ELUMI_v1c02200 [Williamsoniiplasma luminosum]